jgi:predicted flap endonuclease-1-like 5' DNA nuclease
MNGTDTAAGLMSDNGSLTTASLVVIAILVIVVILAIWWGSRLRARQQDDRPAATPPLTTERSVAPAPVEPPVAPAPPPLADTATGALVEPESAAPAAPTDKAAQPVTLLKGLGPKVAARLGEIGITTVGQIAALSPAEAEALDADLGSFRGRMARDRWIEQAKLLAAGDTAGYEATFGKLG